MIKISHFDSDNPVEAIWLHGLCKVATIQRVLKEPEYLEKSGRLRSAFELKTLGLSGMEAIENTLHGH